jgi:hypothetical protein
VRLCWSLSPNGFQSIFHSSIRKNQPFLDKKKTDAAPVIEIKAEDLMVVTAAVAVAVAVADDSLVILWTNTQYC